MNKNELELMLHRAARWSWNHYNEPRFQTINLRILIFWYFSAFMLSFWNNYRTLLTRNATSVPRSEETLDSAAILSRSSRERSEKVEGVETRGGLRMKKKKRNYSRAWGRQNVCRSVRVCTWVRVIVQEVEGERNEKCRDRETCKTE